jgi:hypothetical protein
MEPNAWAAYMAEQYGSAIAARDALAIAPGPRGFEDFEGRPKWDALTRLAHKEQVAINEAEGLTWAERFLRGQAEEKAREAAAEAARQERIRASGEYPFTTELNEAA